MGKGTTRRREGDLAGVLTGLGHNQARTSVDLALTAFAHDRRAVTAPWLRVFGDEPSALAQQAVGFDIAALDAAHPLSASVEEATASLAVSTARWLLAWEAVAGAVAEVCGVAAVADRGGSADQDKFLHFQRQRRSRAPAHQDRLAEASPKQPLDHIGGVLVIGDEIQQATALVLVVFAVAHKVPDTDLDLVQSEEAVSRRQVEDACGASEGLV